MALIIRSGEAFEALEIDFSGIEALANRQRLEILKLLLKQKLSLKELAKHFKTSQQKIYYHLAKMKKAGIVAEEEKRYFAKARNFAFLLEKKGKPFRIFKDFKPFAENGLVKCRIVVGSPDPHGASRARARDGHIAAEVAAFFGSFGALPNPFVLTDQEIRDLSGNLVLVGGPVVNLITAHFNKLFPVRFEGRAIVSPSRKYEEDEIGFVARAKNPNGGELLLIAGRTRSATRAAALALRELAPNIEKAVVVAGFDEDGDGIVDGFEVVEEVK